MSATDPASVATHGHVRCAERRARGVALEPVAAAQERFGAARGQADGEPADRQRLRRPLLEEYDEGADGADDEIPARRVEAEAERPRGRAAGAGAPGAAIERPAVRDVGDDEEHRDERNAHEGQPEHRRRFIGDDMAKPPGREKPDRHQRDESHRASPQRPR